jgi:CCDC93, coiled-coil domain
MAMNEETQQQLQEITDLLVAAGYFRARIKTLPAFDKVDFTTSVIDNGLK